MLFRTLEDGIQPPVAECLIGFGRPLAPVANIAEEWPPAATNHTRTPEGAIIRAAPS
jgi:hypothetical protein